VDDALNMRAHEVYVATINMCMKNMKDQIIVATNSNQQYVKIKETLQQ
jgi:hypothetical protein